MTQRQNKIGKKSVSLLTLLLVMLLSFSMLFVTACGNSDSSSDSSHTISTEETDEQDITNGNFEFGTADIKISQYPYSSNISWTKSSADAASSTLDSGIIATTEAEFKAMREKLYGETVDKELKEVEGYETMTEEEKTAKRNELLDAKLINPGTPENASGKTENSTDGTKVLMINNKTSNSLYLGTAQKYTSSKAITLAPNSYGKITVNVKTANLKTKIADTNFGANINLINTINTVTQSQLQIKNIQASDWTEYTIYVKGNDLSDVTLKVVLGLGYSDKSSKSTQYYVEGQAFFDEVIYSEMTKAEYETAAENVTVYNTSYVSSASTDTIGLDATNNKTVKAIALNCAPLTYATDSELLPTPTLTEGNVGISSYGAVEGAPEVFENKKGYTFTLNKQAATVNFRNALLTDNNFYYITFYVKTDLKLANVGLNILVKDKGVNGALDSTTNGAKITKLVSDIRTEGTEDDKLGDWVKYGILINNNFKNDTAQERGYEINFAFGPIGTATDDCLYPEGTVSVANIKVMTGEIKNDKDKNNDLYTMLNKTVDSSKVTTVALYADRDADFTEEDEDETYNFKTAANAKGAIENFAAELSGYVGVVGNHEQVNPTDENAETAFTSANVVNGLINTKYLNNYTSFLSATDADKMFGYLKDDEYIQPLMIYNKAAESYGYISNTKNAVAASSYYTVTVKVKVMGAAKAYVYLVNSEHEAMASILNQKFENDSLKLNNDVYAVVDSNTKTDDNGWATVTFYVSAGKDAMNFRVELWNGSRDGKDTSTGYVFFNDVAVASSTEAAFQSAMNDYTFSNKQEIADAKKNGTYVTYTQALTKDEIKFNKTASDDDKIKYDEKVIYFSNGSTFVYTRFDTINPVVVDPTDSSSSSSSSSATDNTNKANAATFWLSFSSILLAVVIIALLVLLVVRKAIAKRKAKKSGAIQSYDIHSRNNALKDSRAKQAEAKKAVVKPEAQEKAEDAETAETNETADKSNEYTYGDVQDFSADEKAETEESTETSEENNNDENK